MSIKGKPKLCKNGCNLTIVWYHDDATRQEYFAEMDSNGQATKRHKCLNWRPSSQKTPTSMPTLTPTTTQLDNIKGILICMKSAIEDVQVSIESMEEALINCIESAIQDISDLR